MKKINLIGIECAVLLMLILIPFASCYDLDGDGVDDGQQNLCGDGFCQPTEDVASCPSDCTNPSALPSSPPVTNESNEINTNETIVNNENLTNGINNNSALDNSNISTNPNETNNVSTTQTSGENLPNENVFFVSTTFKIIIGIVALIIIGLIVFFLIRANKNQNLGNSNQSSVPNSQ
jgi:hypothetical protein